MMKKKYEKPNTHTVLLQGREHMLNYSVSQYDRMGPTTVGDVNEE